MELRCLPKPRLDSRIRLWRNTVQLFHKTIKSDFSGPFFTAGYRDYRIEPILLTDKGEEKTPDIVAFDKTNDKWVCIELTNDSRNSKTGKLNEYHTLDSDRLSFIFGKNPCSSADVISSRLSWIDDGDHCQLIVNDILEVYKIEHIRDQKLRDALGAGNGKDLSHLPEIPISLVPESKSRHEIRRGLIDIIMLLFSPNCAGLSAYEITCIALERLEKRTSSARIKTLSKRIDGELKDLVETDLKGFLFRDKHGVYRAVKQPKDHPQTREMIAKRILTWATTKQTKITDPFTREGSKLSQNL